jgi:hypothetical protein
MVILTISTGPTLKVAISLRTVFVRVDAPPEEGAGGGGYARTNVSMRLNLNHVPIRQS